MATSSLKPVPLLDLNRQNRALNDELTAAFQRTLDSGHFILGAAVEEFETAAARFLAVKHALTVSSGTDAILLALMALGIGPGDEVICPSFTFFATAGCIARAGATPVFADVYADTFNIDVEDAASRITEKSKAIIPVHLFGQSAAMEPLLALAKRHGLAVIEDAAQALGARYHNQACGTQGDVGTYSFFPSKNLGGFGDGGLVATNDDRLAEQMRLLRTHGAKPKYYHKHIGGNFRMDALQCALLQVKLPHLPAYIMARQQNAGYYSEHISPSAGVILPMKQPGNEHIWNQYTLRIQGAGGRDALKAHLARQGIGHEIYYPLPLHQQECFAQLKRVSLPVSESLSQEVISIPIFPELSSEERERVISAIQSWIR
jgi:dTDP-4-amino-4,6-dideoxygalactose transaminase